MPCHLEPQQLSPTVPLHQEGKQEIKGQRPVQIPCSRVQIPCSFAKIPCSVA
jgi:hypothetical protein